MPVDWKSIIEEQGFTMEQVEKTRQEVFNLLEEDWYPYLREWDFPDSTMLVALIYLSKNYTLKKFVNNWHNIKKRHYHERRGTPIPKD